MISAMFSAFKNKTLVTLVSHDKENLNRDNLFENFIVLLSNVLPNENFCFFASF